jgi:hypothetical protein
MRPPHLSWRDYLKGYGRLRWKRPGDEQRFHELLGLLQPLYALRCGDLLRAAGPKQVIAEPTRAVAVERGHTPFCFRLQCLITGRLSRYVPYERLIEFGILTADTRDGGPFPRAPAEVPDRIAALVARFQRELDDVRPVWDDPAVTPWHERYTEYLQSEDWLQLREAVLRRDNYRCALTGKASRPGDPLQVHHLTYERVGAERLEDLVTVCRSRHKELHERGKMR